MITSSNSSCSIVEYRTKPMFLSLTSPRRGVIGHVRTEGHEQDRKQQMQRLQVMYCYKRIEPCERTIMKPKI